MPTLSIKLTEEALHALLNDGEAVLTATLKVRKKLAPSLLPPDQQKARQRAIEVWMESQPDVPVARAMKALNTLKRDWMEVLRALDCALDWNKGRPYAPEWFVKDFQQWLDRANEADTDIWGATLERDNYRRRLGLK